MTKWWLGCLLGVLALCAQAQVKVEDAWVRATVAQQTSTGAFMRLTAETDQRLVAVSSPVAGVAEVHEMAMQQDVMRMRAVKSLALAAGKATEFKPGGYHVMLMDLKQPVKAGDTVPLRLVFEGAAAKRSTVEVLAVVRALQTGGSESTGHAHTPASGHKHGH